MTSTDSDHRGYTRDGLVPVPDPTILTTAQLDRAIESVEAKILIRFESLEKLIDAKLKTISHDSVARYDQIRVLFDERELRTKAISDHIAQARDELVKSTKDAGEFRNLVQAHSEKFKSVEMQFHERDARIAQMQHDSKTAIDAALAAAKDSVEKQNQANVAAAAKSEAAFTKQIDQLGYLSQQTSKATDDKINDLKERVQALESQRKGGSDAWGYLLGFGSLIVVVVSVITLVVLLSHHA